MAKKLKPICPACKGTGVIMDGCVGGWDCDYCGSGKKYRRLTKTELKAYLKTLSPLDADMVRISA